MYTEIFNLCRKSATSGTKSCWVKSGSREPDVLGRQWVSKTPKNLGAAWTFRGPTVSKGRKISTLTPILNVQWNFRFVLDVGAKTLSVFWCLFVPGDGCDAVLWTFSTAAGWLPWATKFIPISLVATAWQARSLYWLQCCQKKTIAEIAASIRTPRLHHAIIFFVSVSRPGSK